MKQELDEALCAKYPLIFKNRHAPMTHTAMCWGFDCGNGWYNIIDILCSKLTSKYQYAKDRYEHIKEYYDTSGSWPWKDGKPITAEEVEERRLEMERQKELVPVASQVKEKFGGLRFYVEGGTDEHYNYISFAEHMSYRTCEQCGSPGRTYYQGWHRTVCDAHADEIYGEDAAAERNKTGEWSEEE